MLFIFSGRGYLSRSISIYIYIYPIDSNRDQMAFLFSLFMLIHFPQIFLFHMLKMEYKLCFLSIHLHLFYFDTMSHGRKTNTIYLHKMFHCFLHYIALNLYYSLKYMKQNLLMLHKIQLPQLLYQYLLLYVLLQNKIH